MSVQSCGAQDDTHHHVKNENSCRGELGFVNQDLSDETENAAAEEGGQIGAGVTHDAPPFSVVMATA